MSEKHKKSYQFKIEGQKSLQTSINHLSILTVEAANELLKLCWSTSWMEQLASSKLRAYKIINENRVSLTKDGKLVYLPSRIRRCIAETVGRTLRSQYKRWRCFEHTREALQVLDITKGMNSLIRAISATIYLKHGVYYKWTLLKQTIRQLRYWYIKRNLDIFNIAYIALVRPIIKKFAFPYSPDDKQAIEYEVKEKKIKLKIKIPLTDRPYSQKDWKWFQTEIKIPSEVKKRIQTASSPKPCQPDFFFKTLKSGILVPVLQFAWDFKKIKLDYTFYKKQRMLAVDLGEINLLASVVCETRKQVSQPMYYKRPSKQLQRIDRIYDHIGNNQKKLSSCPLNAKGSSRRKREITRLHNKLTNRRKQELSFLVNELLRQAQHYQCSTIILEDLRSFSPPRNRKSLSRRLNNWIRGQLYSVLVERAQSYGFIIKRVNPRGTSSYCPRCGCKGNKIKAPNDQTITPRGRYFHCPSCSFTADRDYIAALNVYRMFTCRLKNCFSLVQAHPILYTSIGLPLYRMGGKTP